MQNQSFVTGLFKKVFSLVFLASLLAGALPVWGQSKRGVPSGNASARKGPVKPAGGNQKPGCNGGWSGVITYTKTRNYRWDSGKKKQIPHGIGQTITDEVYKYTGRVVVDGSQDANRVMAKGQVIFTHDEKKWRRQDQNDTCFYDGIDGSVHQWTEQNDSKITNAFGEGEAQFNMSIYPSKGTYSFSFRLPDAQGTIDEVYNKTAGGWCNPEWNKPENSTKKRPTREDGQGTDRIGEQPIDPANPDVLSGTKSWVDVASYAEAFKDHYTITWSFKRCPAPVEVTDIKFDEHPYPDYKTWKEIETVRGTVDGNRVRIRATVTNFSGETRFPNLKFNEMVENWVLPDGESSIRLGPGESREVQLIWDTAGYAWKGKGWDAESYRKIKVEAEDSGRKSELTKLIVVKPRPVILAHGLWSNAAAWAGYEKYFEQGHSAAWKSFAVGADPGVAKMNTGESFGNTAQTNSIHENARELDKQIEHVRKDLNSWHVDIVAHSMGGLIARSYITQRMPFMPIGNKPAVTKLIMLGTPNAGSPCAELMYSAMSLAGHKVRALYELIPSVVVRFNDNNPNHRGVRFSALVGWRVPATCQSPAQGDGVVTVGSARFKIKDWKYSNSLAHTDLTSRADFGNFVFPRLSTGPRGNHDPDLVEVSRTQRGNDFADERVASSADRYGFNGMFQKASYKTEIIGDDGPMGDVDVEGMTMAKQMTLAAGQTAEVDVPMTAGSRASVVFAAPPNVSVTLTDAAGAVLGKNVAGSPESKQIFRTIAVDRPVTAGTWKLKLENKESASSSVVVAAFADPNPLAFELTAGKPTATKQIPLQATLTLSGRPVTAGSIKAKLQSNDGKTVELALLDDGAHGDGAAGDGVYGATTEKLADGDYVIEATAETNGQTRLATAALSVGEPTPAAKTVVKAIKK